MDLGKWLDDRGWVDGVAAERLGVSRETVRLWRAGRRMPRAEHLILVRRLSRGQVCAMDFAAARERRRKKDESKCQPNG